MTRDKSTKKNQLQFPRVKYEKCLCNKLKALKHNDALPVTRLLRCKRTACCAGLRRIKCVREKKNRNNWSPAQKVNRDLLSWPSCGMAHLGGSICGACTQGEIFKDLAEAKLPWALNISLPFLKSIYRWIWCWGWVILDDQVRLWQKLSQASHSWFFLASIMLPPSFQLILKTFVNDIPSHLFFREQRLLKRHASHCFSNG